jgi:hypothetical protein
VCFICLYPTYQGTREMCRVVQDVGILRFYFSKQKWFGTINCLSDVTGCRKTQIGLSNISYTIKCIKQKLEAPGSL